MSETLSDQQVSWLQADLAEEREDRANLRRALKETRERLARVISLFPVDPDDESAVISFIADLKAFKAYKSRQRTGKLRVGEDNEVTTIAHYEAKLRTKRDEIRGLIGRLDAVTAERDALIDEENQVNSILDRREGDPLAPLLRSSERKRFKLKTERDEMEERLVDSQDTPHDQ